jgi:DNA-binding protein HU-beta
MTKSELIAQVVEQIEDDKLTKKLTEEVIEATFEVVKAALQEDSRFSFPGFGTFTVKERAERKGRNPRTNEEITIPASRTVTFKPAPRLKTSLND